MAATVACALGDDCTAWATVSTGAIGRTADPVSASENVPTPPGEPLCVCLIGGVEEGGSGRASVLIIGALGVACCRHTHPSMDRLGRALGIMSVASGFSP